MEPKDKNTASISDNIIQYYLDELAQVKLLDRSTLLRLHHKINSNAYYDKKVFNSISKNILKDSSIN